LEVEACLGISLDLMSFPILQVRLQFCITNIQQLFEYTNITNKKRMPFLGHPLYIVSVSGEIKLL
jgi:hypothetical protein